MDAIVVTGLGAVCAAARDVPDLVDALAERRGGIRPITRFDASFVPGAVAGEVPGLGAHDEPSLLLGARAAVEAWEAAGRPEPARLAVVAGSSSGPHGGEDVIDDLEATDPRAAASVKRDGRHRGVAVAAGDAVGAGGIRVTVSTACASGLTALATAIDLLRAGHADVVLAGGAEGLSARRLAGFAALGALSPGPCAPFSSPVGMSLGEGAAFLVLEREADAVARGAPIRAYVRGAGSSADAVHATSPDPRGDGVARAITAALADAAVLPADVDWVSAHATGTEANDAAEWLGLCRVFGEPPPVTGLKSMFGHSFGAAGALEAVVAVLSLERQTLPATLGFAGPRAIGPRDPVAAGPRPARLRTVVLDNAAFGGANVAAVLASGPGGGTSLRPVFLAGIGEAAPGDREPVRLERDPDPGAALLAVAAHRALRAAGVRVGRDNRDAVGLWVGASRRPVTASAAYRASIRERGLGGASAAAFARTVTNAAAGAVSRALDLRGPTAAVSAGPGSALLALLGAAGAVARGSTVVVGAADELDPVLAPLDPETDAPGGETAWGAGAAAVVLAARGPVRLSFAVGGDLPGALGRSPRPDRVWSTALGPRAAARERAAVAAAWGDVPIEPAPVVVGESWTALRVVAAAARAGGRSAVVCDDPGVGGICVTVEGA